MALADPAPRVRQHVLISVDDHVIEPPDMFDGRLPAALAAVLVGGVGVCRDGAATGAMPGTVLRSGRDTETVGAS